MGYRPVSAKEAEIALHKNPCSLGSPYKIRKNNGRNLSLL